MSKLNLHLEHAMVCDLTIAEKDPARNVLVYLPKDECYCTYRVDPEGNCYMGNYGIRTVQEGVTNLLERAACPVVILPEGSKCVNAKDILTLNLVQMDLYMAVTDPEQRDATHIRDLAARMALVMNHLEAE